MFAWASRRRPLLSIQLVFSTCVSALSWVGGLWSIHEDAPELGLSVTFGHDDHWPWDWREPQLPSAAAGTSERQTKPMVPRRVRARFEPPDAPSGNPHVSPAAAADGGEGGASPPPSERRSIGDAEGVTGEGALGGVAQARPPRSVDPFPDPIGVLRSSPLHYPKAARNLGLGVVTCTAQFRLDRRGRPLDIEVTACPEPFHGPLRLDLARWRFPSPDVPGTSTFSLRVTYDPS